MKKLWIFLLLTALLFSFSACQTDSLEELLNSFLQSSDVQNAVNSFLESSDVQNLNPDASVYDEWQPLVGYWHAADGQFFLLDMADSHSAYFSEGIWDTEYVRAGPVTSLALAGETVHSGTVSFPSVEGTEAQEALPALECPLTVDWTDLDNDGKIRITLGENTYYCAFAGKTAQEAYQVHLQNIADKNS